MTSDRQTVNTVHQTDSNLPVDIRHVLVKDERLLGVQTTLTSENTVSE